MLVLTRRAGETILIGDLVEIQIVVVYEHGVRLTIRFLKTDTPPLAMTLNTNQSMEIGNQIVLLITSCMSNRARIGITAPPDLPIARGEIHAIDDATVTPNASSQGVSEDDPEH